MVLEYYDKNLPKALMSVFPDIGLQENSFYKRMNYLYIYFKKLLFIYRFI